MRCSITNATVQQVREAGGLDIKEAPRVGLIFATLTKEQIGKLRSLGCRIDSTQSVKADITPPTPMEALPVYDLSELVRAAGYEELRSLTDPPLYGEGVNIAVIDTGIRETHVMVAGRVMYRRNFTSDPMEDGFDHGTGVASVILAVAPLCNILNLKVLDNEGEGTEEEVVLAIDHCIDLRDINPDYAPVVINLSLGAPDDGNPNNPLRIACRVAIEEGVFIVASSGNFGPGSSTVTSPATEKYVGAVGSASYEPFAISSFSSRGPTMEGLIKPDVVMFGEDIVVASSVSDTTTIAKSGTSFSSPFVAGMAICYHEGMQRQAALTEPLPDLDPKITWLVPIDDIIDRYLPGVCIKPEGVPSGKDNDYGNGMPFGPLVAQSIGLQPTVDVTTVTSLITAVMTIGMIGIVMKGMGNGSKRSA